MQAINTVEDEPLLPPDFPESVAPIAPILSAHTFGRDERYHFPSLMALTNKINVSSGRAAIALALKHAKIGQGDEVLAPAFHCESMIAPIHYVGANPVFYSISSDAQVDINKCQSLLTDKTKAIMVTHYFGFPQDLEKIQAFCKKNNLILIEDCAHSIYGSHKGKAIGSAGDYAIASTMKFFPVYDGGILASDKHSLDSIKLTPCSLSFEVKSALTIVERSIRMGRFSTTGRVVLFAANIKDKLWRHLKGLMQKKGAPKMTPAFADGGFNFDPDWIHVRASKSSLSVIKHADIQRIIELRRARYQYYLHELRDLPGLRFLHPRLPDEVVPLIVPIYFENTKKVFRELKLKGVPIWRFGEFLDAKITSRLCPQSINFSKNLLQFPCHQELTDEEVTWIVKEIKLALKNTQDSA